ncbi:phospholipase D-like domain-containing protein [Peribacillus simplex]|uniref:phospholipase D-like domain-containing protein n=1 Tax=Peribacillus simplex TaxID=1478 RepID=UPI00298D7173|nr:phospholipase D-like domain-containing protein [Peribacillus simplex]MDW7615199.1 phospholipase D-like domain-containing protein [Peribacillus simplex]
MKWTIPNVKSEVILSYQENGYQKVLDEFQQASSINIVTYNINTFELETNLIKELRKVDSSTPITLILNIPARREDYINKKTGKVDQGAVNNALIKIKYTLKVLERQKFGDLNVYFNFDNHAKLIMTDRVAYIGSQNFSDASQSNFELGVLVNDPDSIVDINSKIFGVILNKSIRYATSDYIIVMEEIAGIMKDVLKSIREDVFTWVGDEPYIPDIEIFDMEHASFQREKWEEFKEIHYRFEDIIEKIISDYPSEFDKDKARTKVCHLSNLVKGFVDELNELAEFETRAAEPMMWKKFRELDLGDNMEDALEEATYHMRDYKQEKFHEIERKGTDLIKSFDYIEECIKEIEMLIDEIKDAMITKSVYQNIELINNFE